MAHLTLTLLGGFAVRAASGTPVVVSRRKAQALLAYLALHPGRGQPRDKLVALLWPELPESLGRQNLRRVLLTLRRELPVSPAPLAADDHGVELTPDVWDVDVSRFERLVAEGTPSTLEDAAECYRGDLLAGLSISEPPYEEWLVGERERLRELALEGLARLLAAQQKSGPAETAIQTALRLLALDPLQEVVHRALMRLYVRQGRRTAALRHYQGAVELLQRELGVEPEPETRELYQAILRRAPASPALAGEPASGGERAPAAEQTAAWGAEIAVSTPLVGRDAEMVRLRGAVDAAAQGQGSVVAILGDAGIGKSRLLTELGRYAVERRGRILLGHAWEASQILAFGPWVDAIRTGGVLAHADLPRWLDRVWLRELGVLFPELEDDRAVRPPGLQDHLRLFEAMAHLLDRLSADRPLLLLLEDLHWADEMSVRLLAFLQRRLRTSAVTITLSVREEDVPEGSLLQRLLADRSSGLERLTLAPLSRAEMDALVRTVARAGTDAIVLTALADQTWAASAGNPFIAIETVQALERGIATAVPVASPLPQRAREVVAARLSRLGPRARQLADVAAVIRQPFEFELVHRAAGMSDREGADALDELVRRRVLQGVDERFDFSHEYVREVVYDEILPPRRKVLHRQVADALEQFHAADVSGHVAALGRHYAQGQAWAKAVRYLRAAGLQARARSASSEAAECFRLALEAAARLPEGQDRLASAVDLRVEVGFARLRLADFAPLPRLVTEAEALAERLGDPMQLGWVLVLKAQWQWLTRQYAGALDAGQRALRIGIAAGHRGLEAESRGRLGLIQLYRGDYRAAVEILEGMGDALLRNTVEEIEPRLPEGPSWVGFTLAWALTELGDFDRALAYADAAVRHAEAEGRESSLAIACFASALPLLRRGAVAPAANALERSLHAARRAELEVLRVLILSSLALAHALLGRLRDALFALEEGMRRAKATGFRAGPTLALAEAWLEAGRADEATELLRRLVADGRRYGERGFLATGLRLLGDATAQREPTAVEAAQESYREALALAEELGMRPLAAHAHRGLWATAIRIGDAARAAAHGEWATALYRELAMTAWLERTETAAARRR